MRAIISVVCLVALVFSFIFLIGEPTPGGYFESHFGMFVLSKVVSFGMCYGCVQLIKFVNTSDKFND